MIFPLASARFGEALRITQDGLNEKNFYAFNPSFDKHCNPQEPMPVNSGCGCGCGGVKVMQEPTAACGVKEAEPLTAASSCGCGAQEAEPAPESTCGCGDAASVCEPAPACGCGQMRSTGNCRFPFTRQPGPYAKRGNFGGCGCG